MSTSPTPFRIKAEVVQDEIFQQQLSEAMSMWQTVRSFGLDVLTWWENLVNLLRLRQGYLNRKIVMGETWRLGELKAIHASIEDWYSKESSKIKYQSQADEHQFEEKVRIYHHDLHRKKIKSLQFLNLRPHLAYCMVIKLVQSTLSSRLKISSCTQSCSTKLIKKSCWTKCCQFSQILTTRSFSSCQPKLKYMTP